MNTKYFVELRDFQDNLINLIHNHNYAKAKDAVEAFKKVKESIESIAGSTVDEESLLMIIKEIEDLIVITSSKMNTTKEVKTIIEKYLKVDLKDGDLKTIKDLTSEIEKLYIEKTSGESETPSEDMDKVKEIRLKLQELKESKVNIEDMEKIKDLYTNVIQASNLIVPNDRDIEYWPKNIEELKKEGKYTNGSDGLYEEILKDTLDIISGLVEGNFIYDNSELYHLCNVEDTTLDLEDMKIGLNRIIVDEKISDNRTNEDILDKTSMMSSDGKRKVSYKDATKEWAFKSNEEFKNIIEILEKRIREYILVSDKDKEMTVTELLSVMINFISEAIKSGADGLNSGIDDYSYVRQNSGINKGIITVNKQKDGSYLLATAQDGIAIMDSNGRNSVFIPDLINKQTQYYSAVKVNNSLYSLDFGKISKVNLETGILEKTVPIERGTIPVTGVPTYGVQNATLNILLEVSNKKFLVLSSKNYQSETFKYAYYDVENDLLGEFKEKPGNIARIVSARTGDFFYATQFLNGITSVVKYDLDMNEVKKVDIEGAGKTVFDKGINIGAHISINSKDEIAFASIVETKDTHYILRVAKLDKDLDVKSSGDLTIPNRSISSTDFSKGFFMGLEIAYSDDNDLLIFYRGNMTRLNKNNLVTLNRFFYHSMASAGYMTSNVSPTRYMDFDKDGRCWLVFVNGSVIIFHFGAQSIHGEGNKKIKRAGDKIKMSELKTTRGYFEYPEKIGTPMLMDMIKHKSANTLPAPTKYFDFIEDRFIVGIESLLTSKKLSDAPNINTKKIMNYAIKGGDSFNKTIYVYDYFGVIQKIDKDFTKETDAITKESGIIVNDLICLPNGNIAVSGLLGDLIVYDKDLSKEVFRKKISNMTNSVILSNRFSNLYFISKDTGKVEIFDKAGKKIGGYIVNNKILSCNIDNKGFVIYKTEDKKLKKYSFAGAIVKESIMDKDHGGYLEIDDHGFIYTQGFEDEIVKYDSNLQVAEVIKMPNKFNYMKVLNDGEILLMEDISMGYSTNLSLYSQGVLQDAYVLLK